MATKALGPLRYIALYLRISVDKAGRAEGISRQEKWGRAYVAAAITAGLLPDLPIRVYKDNDVSAFDDDAHRPDYDALREAIRAGEVAAVWAVEQTRLEANRRRWVELTIELEEAGIGEIHTNRDGVVRLDEVADIKNVLSYRERKRARERLKDTLNDMADEGRPKGGSCYGYRPGRDANGVPTLEVVPREAAVIRWAADALLSGWSITSACEAINVVSFLMRMFGHPGVQTKRAGQADKNGRVVRGVWQVGNLSRTLLVPTIAGYRVHHGRIHRRGQWEPILDEMTWRRVSALLTRQRTVKRKDGATMLTPDKDRAQPRKYLLTGLLFCGRCGHHLTGRRQAGHRPGTSRHIYYCLKVDGVANMGNPGGCSQLAGNAEPVETEVVGRFLRRLDSDSLRAQLAADDNEAQRRAILTDLEAVEGQHVALARRWATGDVPEAAWDAARVELDARTSELSAQLAAMPPPVGDVDVDAILDGWANMTTEEHRHLLRMFLSRVVLLPARGGGKFRPERVEVYDRDGHLI